MSGSSEGAEPTHAAALAQVRPNTLGETAETPPRRGFFAPQWNHREGRAFPSVVRELPPGTYARDDMDRSANESPAGPSFRHQAMVYSFLPDAEITGRSEVKVLSLDKDLDQKFISALRKFKLLYGAWPVYADASSARLSAQLGRIRDLCLRSGRSLPGRIEQCMARHQVSVKNWGRVA